MSTVLPAMLMGNGRGKCFCSFPLQGHHVGDDNANRADPDKAHMERPYFLRDLHLSRKICIESSGSPLWSVLSCVSLTLSASRYLTVLRCPEAFPYLVDRTYQSRMRVTKLESYTTKTVTFVCLRKPFFMLFDIYHQ